MVLKFAWGICGSGDSLRNIIQIMRDVIEEEEKKIRVYVFLSKAAQFVLSWYGLKGELEKVSSNIFIEVDANKTEPFYYLPGALQLNKFKFYLICPATANTVAKIVNGIADTLITNSAAQAAKAKTPIYIFPVDHRESGQVTILPDGSELSLHMRRIDIENTKKLHLMESFKVFTDPPMIKTIIEDNLD